MNYIHMTKKEKSNLALIGCKKNRVGVFSSRSDE